MIDEEPKKRQNGSSIQGGSRLSRAKTEVLALFKLGMSSAQIAVKRDCSPRYVRRVLRELHEFGLVPPPVPHRGYTPELEEPFLMEKNPKPPMEKNFFVRVHAQRFRFSIISKGPRFKPGLSQHLSDGTWVRTWNKSVVIHAPPGSEFVAPTAEAAEHASFDHWARVFRKVEHDLDVQFFKPRRAFRITYTEIAHPDAPEAAPIVEREGLVRVFDPIDGRLRFSIDRSKGPLEAEFHHASKAGDDSPTLHRQILGLLANPDGPTLPQLASVVEELGVALKSQVEALSSLVERSTPPPSPPPAPFDKRLGGYFG